MSHTGRELNGVSRKEAEISITGMTCGACSAAVAAALDRTAGTISHNISLVTERAIVEFSDGDPNDFVRAIEDAGFDAELVKVVNSENSNHDGTLPNARKVELRITGMTCGNCTSSVKSAVEQLQGVHSVIVSLTTELCTAICEEIVDAQAIVTAVEDAGFDAQLVSNACQAAVNLEKDSDSLLNIKVFGMNSDESATTVKSTLANVYGIKDVSIDLSTSVASISYDKSITGIRSIFGILEDAGINALVSASADNSQQVEVLNRVKELKSYYSDALTAFLLGVPTIIMMKLRKYLPAFLTARVGRGIWVDDIVCSLMVAPIILGPARRFYVKAYKSIKAGAPTMDVLVSCSVTCAFVYSTVALVHAVVINMAHHQMYLWDACAMILMFVLLGKYLENLARGHTSQALSELISLVPEETLVIAEDLDKAGQLISTDMLQVNDVVILRPGERVTADGVVVDGSSFISEALLTGESKYISKSVGDKVVGGTINGLGTLRFRVTSCGADTKLSQIVSLVKEAQGSRAPIQRYADIAAAKFVPAILGLSFCTFFGWLILGSILGTEKLPFMFHNKSLFFMCLRLAIAVIVVACPCALGLATPTAVMVATGVGAKAGILVKGGGIFELGAKASVVLFDKTGTLTTGKMSVVANTVPAEHWPTIRALEMFSEHPAGKAISAYYHREEIQGPGKEDQHNVDNVTVLPGEGIRGTVDGVFVFIGRRIQEEDSQITVILGNEFVGNIVLEDPVRSEAFTVVETLKMQGFKVGIVSGDSTPVVESIANMMEIESDYSWSLMRPDDKVKVVERLRSEGNEVVFVGDGINDSPALATASVGVSIEGATHVAVESADIVLTQDSPIAAVPAALDLCRATMRRIKLNLFVSVIYNAIMIPFAMGLLLPLNIMLSPMMASASMALSSVSVVVSSLLLRRWHVDRVNKVTQTSEVLPHWWKRIFTSKFWTFREMKYRDLEHSAPNTA